MHKIAAVIGAGGFGQEHAFNLARNDNVTQLFITRRSIQQAEKQARNLEGKVNRVRFPENQVKITGVHAESDLTKLFRKHEHFDLITIATPSASHPYYIEEAKDRCSTMLVESPILPPTMPYKNIESLLEASTNVNLQLQFHKLAKIIKEQSDFFDQIIKAKHLYIHWETPTKHGNSDIRELSALHPWTFLKNSFDITADDTKSSYSKATISGLLGAKKSDNIIPYTMQLEYSNREARAFTLNFNDDHNKPSGPTYILFENEAESISMDKYDGPLKAAIDDAPQSSKGHKFEQVAFYARPLFGSLNAALEGEPWTTKTDFRESQQFMNNLYAKELT